MQSIVGATGGRPLLINPETRHRRSIRLRNYDYALAGAYFVTMITRDRRCLFGDIVDGKMRLNHCGQTVEDEWEKSARIRNEIELDAFIIMPNHVHGIIVITDASERATSRSPLHYGPAKRSLGAFVGGFKSAVTKRICEVRDLPGRAALAAQLLRTYHPRQGIFLQRIRQYIHENPAQWEFDRENPLATKPESKEAWQND